MLIFASKIKQLNLSMKHFFSMLLALCAMTVLSAQTQERLLLGGWKFQRGSAAGAEQPNYDDSKWESVSIPHDWAIKGPFDKEID